jgi:uncharacterized protein (UPF0332 family)
MSKAIHEAFDLGQIGDDRAPIELDQEQAADTLMSAEQFLKRAEKHLSAQ